jgi:hypothetical protein
MSVIGGKEKSKYSLANLPGSRVFSTNERATNHYPQRKLDITDVLYQSTDLQKEKHSKDLH